MVQVVNKIVVPGRPAVDNGLARAPFKQVHLHSTANTRSTMQNEVDYLSRNWTGAYYTHLVGIDGNGNAAAWQVANTNGGAYDLGGDWNWEGYAAIEFAENIQNQAQFNAAYKVYVELAVQLALEAGIKNMTLDTPYNEGIKTHNYASKTGHGSDHVDPLAFLERWGVSYDQLKLDIANVTGVSATAVKPAATTNKPKPSIDKFKAAGNAFTAYGTFKVDAIKQVNGIWQIVNYKLAGGKDVDWVNNGIPLDILDNVTRGNAAPTQVGDTVKFMAAYNHGTIDDYDTASNGVGIQFGGYGEVWFNADAFIAL